MRSSIALGILLLLTAPAVYADTLPATPTYGAETANGAASQRFCTSMRDFCARADVTASLKSCTETPGDYSCTIHFALMLEADGDVPGCAEVYTEPTDTQVGCVATTTALPYKSALPWMAEKTYHARSPGATISEPALLCIDTDAEETCRGFVVSLRLPGQPAILANSTLAPSSRASQASMTICRDPGASEPACVVAQVVAHVDDCTPGGPCKVTYTALVNTIGEACASIQVASMSGETCGNALFETTKTSRATASGTIHEDGLFCLQGAAGRCISFGLDTPTE